jgi:hypothetical protein
MRQGIVHKTNSLSENKSDQKRKYLNYTVLWKRDQICLNDYVTCCSFICVLNDTNLMSVNDHKLLAQEIFLRTVISAIGCQSRITVCADFIHRQEL